MERLEFGPIAFAINNGVFLSFSLLKIERAIQKTEIKFGTHQELGG